MLTVLFLLWIVLSPVAVAVTVWDKRAAKKRRRRVPEARLLAIAALGGVGAMYITMKLIRHKTKKPKFMVGLPMIWMLHIAAAIALWLL